MLAESSPQTLDRSTSVQDDRPKLKLVYIAGFARSGSTILDNVVARADDVCSLGELRSLWKQGLMDGGLCGCGEPVSECGFWQAVLGQAFDGSPPAPDAVYELQVRHSRIRPHGLLALERAPKGAVADGLREYTDLLLSIYRAAAELTGCATILDSSKTPIEPLALIKLTDLDVRVIHLVRDPRAVAYSISRIKSAPDRPAAGVMRTMNPFTSSAKWLAANATLTHQLRRVAGSRYMLCRYEDFTADPASVVERIRRFADLPAGETAIGVDREMTMETTHGPGGNPDRLRRRTAVIRPDERWRTAMPAGDRLAAAVPALPLLRRYDYPLWV